MADFEPIIFTNKITKKLVNMIQARPCLWNRQSVEYKDRLARDRAWAEIITALYPSYGVASPAVRHEMGLSVTKKWYNLRDSYVKSLKPDYFGRRNRPYVHADLLRFLDDCYLDKINSSYLENVKTKGGAQELEEETEELETEEAETEPWEQKVFVSLDEDEPVAKRRREETPGRSFNDSKGKDDEDIICVLSNLIRKEEDEDRAFFKSITPSVKNLSEESKLAFRIEVLQLIKSLRAKDKVNLQEKHQKDVNNDSDSD